MLIDSLKNRRCFPFLGTLPVLAAIGCSDVSVLGISAEVDTEHGSSAGLMGDPSPLGQALRSSTVISAAADESIQWRRPTLGDVDGDGLDDFAVDAPWTDPNNEHYGYRVYLFYGKSEFPAQLTTADADAVFEAGALPTVALGDVNGDDLADFALADENSVEIVFGTATRFEGTRKPHTSGLTWNRGREGFSPLYLQPIGDVNGDGQSEFRVTLISEVPASEINNRPSELITDYLIAGQSEALPSGTWDPNWAVAQLGDEPPAFEDNGATTVLQRLTLAGTGDLDGDGYVDLLALGRWRIWVFYGSAQGFHGTLKPEQADASLTWPYDSEVRAQFAKTIPFILGDVDGDGTADIALPKHAELGILYGSKRRWSGRVQLEPDLSLVRPTDAFADRNWWMGLMHDLSIGAPLPELVSTTIKVVVADLDGDARPELVLQEDHFPSPAAGDEAVTHVAYAVTGPSKHATGRYVLSDADRYRASGVSNAEAALNTGMLMDPGGDFDGDGSTDLIFGVLEQPSVADSKMSLHLVPGTPHAPD